MSFHMPQKNIQLPIISIDNVAIECVDSFSFLGIYLDKYMNRKSPIEYRASKISKSVGILNRLRAGVCRPCDTIKPTAIICNFSLCRRVEKVCVDRQLLRYS